MMQKLLKTSTVVFVGEFYEQEILSNTELNKKIKKLRELQPHYFVQEPNNNEFKVYYKFGRRSCIQIFGATDLDSVLWYLDRAMVLPHEIRYMEKVC